MYTRHAKTQSILAKNVYPFQNKIAKTPLLVLNENIQSKLTYNVDSRCINTKIAFGFAMCKTVHATDLDDKFCNENARKMGKLPQNLRNTFAYTYVLGTSVLYSEMRTLTNP